MFKAAAKGDEQRCGNRMEQGNGVKRSEGNLRAIRTLLPRDALAGVTATASAAGRTKYPVEPCVLKISP